MLALLFLFLTTVINGRGGSIGGGGGGSFHLANTPISCLMRAISFSFSFSVSLWKHSPTSAHLQPPWAMVAGLPSPALSSFLHLLNTDAFFTEEVSAVLSRRASFLLSCRLRYEGHLCRFLASGGRSSPDSLASENLKIGSSFSSKEKLLSDCLSSVQNSKHCLTSDL